MDSLIRLLRIFKKFILSLNSRGCSYKDKMINVLVVYSFIKEKG